MADWRLWTESDSGRVTSHTGKSSAYSADALARLKLTTYDRITGGKLPRNHNARSYRLTAGSSVLAAATLCYRRMKNCLEVSTALVGDGEGAASKAVFREFLQFVLTDAYRCSGHCALTFGYFDKPQEQAILRRIESTAATYGVELSDWSRRVITVDEGRRLYLNISGLSPAALAVVTQLHKIGRVRSESVCFLLASGVWSASQIERLLLACALPDAVLAGGASPLDRHIHQYAIAHARSAVLAGRLEDHLNNQWEDDEGVVQVVPHVGRKVAVEVIQRSGLLRLSALDSVSLEQWSRSSRTRLDSDGMLASVVAVSGEELQRCWESLIKSNALLDEEGPRAIVVPADFDQLLTDVRQRCLQAATAEGIDVLAAPDTYAQLSAEARRKLSFARIIRR